MNQQARRTVAAALALIAIAAVMAGGQSVVINEIAWGGAAAGSADEWIELYNPTGAEVDLAGWALWIGETRIPLGEAGDGTIEVRRSVIGAYGYLLLERTDDETVSDRIADVLFKGSLSNAGADVVLLDAAGDVVDRVLCAESGWPAGLGGDGDRPYASMERVDPTASPAEWRTNGPWAAFGLDADGNPVAGSPGGENSATVQHRSAPRVEWVAPIEGDLSGVVVIQWSATDPDGEANALRVTVQLCDEAGEACRTVVENLANQGSFRWDTSSYVSEELVYLRVIVSDLDGFTTAASSGALRILAAP